MPDRKRRQPRLPGPDIVRRQVVLEEHDLAPDGSFVIVSRRFVAGNGYASNLYLVPTGAAASGRAAGTRRRAIPVPRQLTRGTARDMRPAISPDGTRVAFTRREPGADAATVLVLVIGGGEADRRTSGLGVGEIAWSPDGRWIAFTAEADPQRLIVGPVVDGQEPRARHVNHLDWRYDEMGYLDRRSQLHVVAAEGEPRPRQLTGIEGGVSGITWRPDGRGIAFVADPRPDADRHPRTSIWEVPFDGRTRGGSAAAHEVMVLAGPVRSPAYSPDGRLIAAVGVDDPDGFDDVAPTLFVGSADGSERAVALAPAQDRPVGSWVDTDLTGWQAEPRPGPVWAGVAAILALVSDRGRSHPWRFPVDPATGRPDGDPVRLASGDAVAVTLASGANRITITATLGARPPELYEVEPDSGLRRLTTLGSTWTDRLAWPEMRLVLAPGPGGPIETWIASPADAGDAPLPTIVDVHGGPLGAWAPAPSIEVVLLCARGYRVVLPNIRGSATYGGDWIRPQLGDWGGVDAADVHAALDHTIALGLADPERLGALGLSYGGFMVNWLVGTTDRFRAAVSENGVTNQVSAWAHSDDGPEYCRTSRMGDPTTPEGVEQLWRQSPLRNVASVRTPLLMLQAEADRRCPPSDNEQYFVALRWLGREVEYVLYPEEFHVYQASGRPDRRIDRMNRVLDWFDRFVGADGAKGSVAGSARRASAADHGA